jgi:LuxR family transcriptional regulator, activator of conjugal transfer of Ti plasmids
MAHDSIKDVTNRESLQLLVDALEGSSTTRAAVTALRAYLAASGFEHCAYLGFTVQPARQVEPFHLGCYPAPWVKEYLRERLYGIDPVVLAASRSTLPLPWSGGVIGDGKGSRLAAEIFERARAYGIRSGYTVPVRSSIGQLAILTYASGLEAGEFRQLLNQHRAGLHLGAFHFHDAIERISAPVHHTRLTPRERTCLLCSSQGMSAKEIARMLDIRPRSVKFHHDNARLKLASSNLRQAVSRAACMGLI